MKSLVVQSAAAILALACLGCEDPAANRPAVGSRKAIAIVVPLSHPSLDASIDGFKAALNASSFAGSLEIETSSANGDLGKLGSIIKQVLAAKPDLIFVLSTPAAAEAAPLAERAKVPLIYTAVTDPVKAGIVSSLQNSNTPATGVTDLYPVTEQVGLFLRIMPAMKSAGILRTAGEENSLLLAEMTAKELESRGVKAKTEVISGPSLISQVLRNLLSEVDCIIVNGDNALVASLKTISNECVRAKKPLFVGDPDSVRQGGVATVGPSYYSLGFAAGERAVRVLEGEAPGSIPSGTPTEYDYIINTEAADRYGLTVPADLWTSRPVWESRASTGGR
jgi:putative ABC transport system substrate-binding protein